MVVNACTKCWRKEREKKNKKNIPSAFLVSLINLIQKYKIFEFRDGQLWKQLYGVAMGIHPAPSFANIYLAKRIDKQINEPAQKYGIDGNSAFIIFKRFLDNICQVFKGTSKQLHNLNNEINQIHPTLKFTMVHTTIDDEPEEDRCNCEKTTSIPF